MNKVTAVFMQKIINLVVEDGKLLCFKAAEDNEKLIDILNMVEHKGCEVFKRDPDSKFLYVCPGDNPEETIF